MKSTKLKSLMVIVTIALTSLAAIGNPVSAPSGESAYQPIPAIPPYIYMADSFQVFSITAP